MASSRIETLPTLTHKAPTSNKNKGTIQKLIIKRKWSIFLMVEGSKLSNEFNADVNLIAIGYDLF